MEQRQHQGQAALLWQAGLDIAATIRVSGGGRKMFLDIPFYRTAFNVSPSLAKRSGSLFRSLTFSISWSASRCASRWPGTMLFAQDFVRLRRGVQV